ncbi:hypothetical protein [Halorussus amylolyticus]|uniref:hypothetical protein n=1 Tax=Halorussus amylolyticus TaxID=1126242 RepID=UPI00104EF27D|nr:hypothetical protein [Halorussus amylolyticus]
MPLRPTDTDVLSDICMSVALQNYGFLYVDQVTDQLRSEYESADKSPLKASSLSATDIKKAMENVAGDEYSKLQRLRTGVYYYDPFGTGNGEDIATELTTLFRQQLVVTGEELRSRFDLAIDDIDFFTDELADRNLVRRIATGERDYYTIGSQLKEQAGEAGVAARLSQRATKGKLTHGELEKEISVSATADVIRYLETQDFIIDLDGEYLVKTAIDEYATKLADQLTERVTEAFGESGYVMPEREYRQLLVTEIKERTDVLEREPGLRDTVVEHVETTLAEGSGETGESYPGIVVDEDAGMAVHEEQFDEKIDSHAEELSRQVLADSMASTPSQMVETVRSDIDALTLATDPDANEYVQREIEAATREKIEEEF